MFIVRKAYAEFRNEFSPLQFGILDIAQTRKQPARGVARRHRDMAVRADEWRRALAREKLRAMALKT